MGSSNSNKNPESVHALNSMVTPYMLAMFGLFRMFLGDVYPRSCHNIAGWLMNKNFLIGKSLFHFHRRIRSKHKSFNDNPTPTHPNLIKMNAFISGGNIVISSNDFIN